MVRLYVVAGNAGERHEHRHADHWIVAAYLDEAKAHEHAALAKRWYQEHAPPPDCEDWGWWSKYPNPYDARMRVDMGEPVWTIQSCLLRDDLPYVAEAAAGGSDTLAA